VKIRLLAAVVITLATSALVAQTTEFSTLGIERSRQQSLTTSGANGPTFLRGNVELTLGAATVSADEAEVRQSPPEAVLRGTVKIRSTPPPNVKANTVKRTAEGVSQFRRNVQVRLGTAGVTVFADEADVSAIGDVELRGNVVLKNDARKR
jgi:lipopolysaccharide export system protein LptA